MIYTTKIVVTADTKTNKLILLNTDGKRIVVTPVTRSGPDAFVVVDDRPALQPSVVTDLLRFLVQNLYGKKQVGKILSERIKDDNSGSAS